MVMIYDDEGVDKTNLKQKSTKKGIVKERKKAYIWYTLGLTANYKKEIIVILISWTRVSKIHVVILFFFFLFVIQDTNQLNREPCNFLECIELKII